MAPPVNKYCLVKGDAIGTMIGKVALLDLPKTLQMEAVVVDTIFKVCPRAIQQRDN